MVGRAADAAPVLSDTLTLVLGLFSLMLLLAFTIMKLLSTVIRLENVSVIDAGAFAASVVIVAGAVGLASYGPARRASRIDPSSMLRTDG